jgi:hypothetical protein
MNQARNPSKRIEDLARLVRLLDRPFLGIMPEDYAKANIHPPTADEMLAANQLNRELHAAGIAKDRANARRVLAERRPDLLAALETT